MTPEERERVYPRLAMVGACWTWLGATTADGYGQVRRDGTRKEGTRKLGRVHRLVYEDLVGDIPEGQQIDHLCRNTRCALPAHLEPVTAQVNTLRSRAPSAVSARRDTCHRGHPYTPENTRIRTKRSVVRGVRLSRVCRTCQRERETR